MHWEIKKLVGLLYWDTSLQWSGTEPTLSLRYACILYIILYVIYNNIYHIYTYNIYVYLYIHICLSLYMFHAFQPSMINERKRNYQWVKDFSLQLQVCPSGRGNRSIPIFSLSITPLSSFHVNGEKHCYGLNCVTQKDMLTF